MLLNLPQDAWQCIAIHLSPPDILSFLSVHPNINNHLANSVSFWKQLLAIHRDNIQYNNDTIIANNSSRSSSNSSSISNVKDARHEFMLQAYKSSLPSVKWLPLDIDRTFPVSAREGHISCVLHGPDNWKNLVITGGFSDDEGVTLVHLPRGIKSHTETWGWTRLQPQHRTTFAYGATLTALSPVDSGNENVTIAKAVRFGGFESGGYSDETNDVWMLTIRDEEYEDGSLSQTANWEKVETTGVAPRPRAYHSATLIHERYLVIIGGMTLHGSCIDEAVLDTATWKWINVSMARIGDRPSGRHGHSVNWDERRDRLVLFGGGSGTDLLRSGVDNSEVWELKMNGVEVPSFDEDGTSWIWSMVHGDSDASNDDDEDDSSNDEEYEEENTNQDYIDGEDNSMKEDNHTSDKATAMNNHLSPIESVCLGRCHNSMKIAPDTVLLMFGGGQTNTNGVIGYNLRTDSFIRPKVTGPLPLPRFTGIASFFDEEGYVFVHGGYNSNRSTSIKDMYLLDLAPFLNRNYTSLAVDTNRPSHTEAVSSRRRIGQEYGIPVGTFLMQHLAHLMNAEELAELTSRNGGL